MSDAASKEIGPGADERNFTEADHRETILGYGDGGVPFFIAVLWVAFIIVYVVVMALVALPDLRAWMAS